MSLLHHTSVFPRSFRSFDGKLSHVGSLALLGLISNMIGCYGPDYADGVGDMGVLEYRMSSQPDLASEDLRSLKIVAGHPQDLSYTYADGEKEIEDTPDVWESELVGADAEISEGPGWLSLTSMTAGTFPLRTMLEGDLVDQIDLSFGMLHAVDLQTWVRLPGDEAFSSRFEESASDVPEGTQIAFVPVPLDGDGERLAGTIQVTVEADPPWAMVQGAFSFGTYESGVNCLLDDTWYIIESGEVVVTLRDVIFGIEASHVFYVSPANPGSGVEGSEGE